jgi:hypothetical protein
VKDSVRSSFTGRQMVVNPGKDGLNGAKVRLPRTPPRGRAAQFSPSQRTWTVDRSIEPDR